MLQVTRIATDRLNAYAGNAKIHTAKQIEQIKQSIIEFGFNDPVGYWENDRCELEIVEGHGRVIAAMELGIDELPCIDLSHMSDAQRRAYTHIHNKLTTNTGIDYDLLSQELQDITGFDWDGLGFDYVDLASSSDYEFEPEVFDYEVDEVADAFVVTVRLHGEDEKDAMLSVVGGDVLRRMYRVGEL